MGACAAKYDRDLRNTERLQDFSFEGTWFRAKCVDVTDIETIRIVFRYLGVLHQYRVHLIGCTQSEYRKHERGDIRRMNEDREWLADLILGEMLYVECGKWDRYGRLRAIIYVQSMDISVNALKNERDFVNIST